MNLGVLTPLAVLVLAVWVLLVGVDGPQKETVDAIFAVVAGVLVVVAIALTVRRP